ncbi:hypothetical protein JVT61DRAFT_4656 [Boletus reticuloceps]|uniref:Uncharacterized protein n=1 Tax=Boletus reticuloceps TaxID=495285 RepID=A0A8I3A3S8_9AGAM|nr:hypothetical protein JVT61DRAFT_11120 [Boletus reticuloceps]KAG6374019.1 hypothetical protein JVT61DRAFT_4656 [Boletus reticuloceps]
MPNDALDRIVGCAHYHKMTSARELLRETGWSKSKRFAGEVIAIINKSATPLGTSDQRDVVRVIDKGYV